MTIVLLEDEAIAARQLADLLAHLLPSARILAILPSVQEAINWFSENTTPDLLFSDIELLDGNAFALFDRVQVSCPIIFTTAYDQFLLRAFQGNGIAYLLKPFTEHQLQQALNKYMLLRTSLTPPLPILTETILNQLRDALRPAQANYRQRFAVKLRQGIHLLDINEITYLQADEGIIFAFDTKGRKYPLNGSLNELEGNLDPALFFRLNRSEMIHIRYIVRLEPYFNDRLAVWIVGRAEPLISSTARTPDLRRWVEE
ncbi:LytTR family DNA-binding domain-containing protein [Siphonobacter sp. SORGH_AS_1065]|uniref:LytR/AlgR family response regulator transcription factor n=1 Tax=Siphonobacter sp. SORGH_AS_1065 TaxID=3041795 RepID=UPI0027887992|nr:LytTR family DNA-binding domain-containing protein [Siphonobacter sp. SORGH_AS_1065]MDQ1090006.1 two-component system response regulator LytT [Siphonobacter sp. SORGH_AS_1065]